VLGGDAVLSERGDLIREMQGSKLDSVAALGRFRFGKAGCTATMIGSRRPDGCWDVLTAARLLRP
jgi:hypothetical protein